MLFSLLFLGLLPVAFMAESFTEGFSDDDDTEEDDAGRGTEPVPPAGPGDFIAVDEGGIADSEDADTVLQPNTEDQVIPGQDISVDDAILKPNNGLGDGETPHQVASLLDRLLGTETDQHYGREDMRHFLGDIDELSLTDANDRMLLPDDGIDGTGAGSVDEFHGTPILRDGDEVEVPVVDGGAGDDSLISGDGAAYLFGNDGDDVITAGEGVLAGFGGDGDDTLDASNSLDSFLDGGAGDDLLIGSDGDDQLFGGKHEAKDNAGANSTDNDVLIGGAGDDALYGGHGADTLKGGEGDDIINHLGHAMERGGAERHDFNWHIDGDQDTLDGGSGNDTLIMDRSNIAIGGEGEDVFWIYSDAAAGEDHAEVMDFVPGQDFLRVSLDPTQDTGALEYDVHPSTTGEDGVVTVNGEVVAILRGAPGATTYDVYVEVAPNVLG
ncbi:calcium-binding protein [Aliiroseovarius sp. F47248L]|uniref:calcium-binding protein n=1 Tax=Aliiroseovarius sp. F47248L TaxID=2926420 RepID=UPI001FF2E9D1|nr:calcium-binding protein [Aliiroseovarius sp. F47248L]MCK0139968.1 hypothetical protein [Aliiroseovarius sp. F47248L]